MEKSDNSKFYLLLFITLFTGIIYRLLLGYSANIIIYSICLFCFSLILLHFNYQLCKLHLLGRVKDWENAQPAGYYLFMEKLVGWLFFFTSIVILFIQTAD